MVELFLQQEKEPSREIFKIVFRKTKYKMWYLSQRPKKEPSCAGNWYDSQVVGMNSLKQLMKVVTQETNLALVCTNRSIRATSVTILDQAGLEACDTMTVSGHRSDKSI